MSAKPCSAVATAFVVAACSTAPPPPNAPPQPVALSVQPAAPVAPAPPKAEPVPQKAPAAKAPAQAQAPAAAPKAASTPPARVAAAPAAAPKAAAPPLDLKSLEERLKETNAIGVLTKLSLKNQVDDLVARFRAYHTGQRPPTLAELRPNFELLLMKALSLLQDKDAALAHDINASREAIWGVLSDPNKLAQFN